MICPRKICLIQYSLFESGGALAPGLPSPASDAYGISNKRNMKSHANLEILILFLSLMIKETHAANNQCVAISLCDLFFTNI